MEAVKSFERFLDKDGRVRQWPSKREDKARVLEYLSTKFDRRVVYTESQVNEILKKWHLFSDWPLLRREMFEAGWFSRTADGSEYRLQKLSS